MGLVLACRPFQRIPANLNSTILGATVDNVLERFTLPKMSPTPPRVLGPKYLTGDVEYKTENDPTIHKQQGWQWFELSYNGRVLKYTVAIFGRQSNTGYPLFIGLCGGGTEAAPGLGNTFSWIDASIRYFHLPVQAQMETEGVFQNEGAILVVPRGVSNLADGDSYFLHSEPESYVLLEALIADLLQKKPQPVFDKAQKISQQSNDAAPYLIDPDRVFLTGYSAGGNGVFQLSQRISDRFAAVNAGAGHPEGTTFKNLANLPTCLQVGEKDWYKANDSWHSRSQVYVQANSAIKALWNNDVYYVHDCYIVRDAVHAGDWHKPKGVDQKQRLLADLTALNPDTNQTMTASEAANAPLVNINPFRWFMKPSNGTGYKRSTAPNWVVWDLGTRPPKPMDVDMALQLNKPGWQPKRFSYWLYLRDATVTLDETLEAGYMRGSTGSWINFKTPRTYCVILLREDMVDFNNNVDVYVGGSRTGTSLTLVANHTIREETWAARKDPKLVYSAAVYLDLTNGTWVPRVASSLASIDVTYKPTARL